MAVSAEEITPTANAAGTIGTASLQWGAIRGSAIYDSGSRVATLASPAFTGNPTAPTQSAGNNSTRLATTAYADAIDAAAKARANHTGTQLAATISDFATAVAATASVTANTAKTSNATHTGDVTGATALTIAAGAVEYAMMDTSDLTGLDTKLCTGTAGTDGRLAQWNADGDLVDAGSGATAAAVIANTAKVSNVTHTGDVTGSTTLTIGSGKVLTAHFAAGAVDTAAIGALQVTGAKIATGTITATNIATGTITATELASGCVEADELASSAVTTAKINDLAVTTAKIAANNVTNAKLAQMAAYNIKMNSTGSTADPEDKKISALTDVPTPAGTEMVMIELSTGELRSTTVSAIASSPLDAETVRDTIGAALTNSDSIEWSVDDSANTIAADINMKTSGLVAGTQGEIGVDSSGAYVKLGATSTTAGAGNLTPTNAQKAALAGVAGTPSSSNKYLTGLFTDLELVTPGSADSIPIWDDSGSATKRCLVSAIGGTLSKEITIESPTISEDTTFFYTPVAITITSLTVVVRGTTPSCTPDIRHHTSRDNAGLALINTPSAVTSESTGSTITTFDDATIPANSFVFIEMDAVSGTVNECFISITYTED